MGRPNVYSNIAQVGTATDWVSISAGASLTTGVRADGTLWAWGQNNDGQLGDGTFVGRDVPTRIGTATNWRSVYTDVDHPFTLAIRQDGSLWGWGKNFEGQLGDGARTPRLAPTRVGTGTSWQIARPATYHSLALQQDGTLWGWGANYIYQVGQVALRNQKVANPLLIMPGMATPTAASPAAATPAPLELWPNPATGQVQLHFEARQPGVLRLLTPLGQVVQARPVPAGNHQLTLPTTGLPPGLYLVQLLLPSGTVSQRLVLR